MNLCFTTPSRWDRFRYSTTGLIQSGVAQWSTSASLEEHARAACKFACALMQQGLNDRVEATGDAVALLDCRRDLEGSSHKFCLQGVADRIEDDISLMRERLGRIDIGGCTVQLSSSSFLILTQPTGDEDDLRDYLDKYCDFIRVLAGKIASWGFDWDAHGHSKDWSQISRCLKQEVNAVLAHGLEEANFSSQALIEEGYGYENDYYEDNEVDDWSE